MGPTGNGLSASNSVPASYVSDISSSITANTLKPSDCSSLTLTAILSGISVTGTNANELILGTSGNDTIDGRAGADCIIGGAGTDTINGGGGGDICIGSLTSTFTNCNITIKR